MFHSVQLEGYQQIGLLKIGEPASIFFRSPKMQYWQPCAGVCAQFYVQIAADRRVQAKPSLKHASNYRFPHRILVRNCFYFVVKL